MDSQYFRVGFHILFRHFDFLIGDGTSAAGIARVGVKREHISAGFLFEIPLLQRFKRRVDRLELVSLFGQAVDELDIDEVLKTIPPEMVEDMKKQAEKYGFPFEEYVQSVLGAIVMDPDLGAY